MAGETVLVADDRVDNREFLREYVLEPNGYRMITARNGKEALDIALSQEVDLIISDLVMPQMGGLELLESLRDSGSELPAILMTFHGSEETAVHAFRLGARDYIIKPYSVEEMLAAIDRALSEARLRRERDKLTQHLVRANRQLKSHVQGLRILSSIGRSITSLLDIEQVLNRIVEAAVYLSNASEGLLMLIDEDSGDLLQRAACRPGQRQAQSANARSDDAVAGEVIHTGEPVVTDRGEAVGASLAVPLKVGEQTIGVLAVNNQRGDNPFSKRHLGLLSALADYASIAILNAHTHAELASEAVEAARYGKVLEQEVAARTLALAKAQSQLQKAERLNAIGHLATGLAHEISAPLEAILHHVQALGSNSNDEVRAHRLLDAIEQEILGCQQTLRSLLIYTGEALQAKQAIDVNLLLERAWEQLKTEKNLPATLEIVTGFDPRLPLVQAEETQLERAFYYIIRSGCDSMAAGGELRLISRTVGDEVQVIIADSGLGIPAEEMQHLFDPFYKTSRHPYGLGLSIAHGVIERHRGRIEVESQAGQGTTFTIYLPVETG
ncbi:MAG: response regulator [Anaerolineae bacterium]